MRWNDKIISRLHPRITYNFIKAIFFFFFWFSFHLLLLLLTINSSIPLAKWKYPFIPFDPWAMCKQKPVKYHFYFLSWKYPFSLSSCSMQFVWEFILYFAYIKSQNITFKRFWNECFRIVSMALHFIGKCLVIYVNLDHVSKWNEHFDNRIEPLPIYFVLHYYLLDWMLLYGKHIHNVCVPFQ